MSVSKRIVRCIVGGSAVVGLMLSTSAAFAAWAPFNVVIPRLGGVTNAGNVQTKATSGGSQYYIRAVGGGYEITGRFTRSSPNEATRWEYKRAGSSGTIITGWGPGTLMDYQLGNKFRTPVNVQVTGSWNAN